MGDVGNTEGEEPADEWLSFLSWIPSSLDGNNGQRNCIDTLRPFAFTADTSRLCACTLYVFKHCLS